MTPYVLFQVGDTSYAVAASQVEQLEMVEELTRVPDSPPFLEGMVYLRGRVVPVINMRVRFGLPAVAFDLSSRLIVVRLDQRLVALAVDNAREYRSFPDQTLEPAPEALMGYEADYLAGVFHQDKRLILVVDVNRLLATTALPTTHRQEN